MRRLPLQLLALAALLLAVTACGSRLPPPQYVLEQPVGSGNWAEVEALPAWVSAPPVEEGVLHFVASGKSNLRSIVTIEGHPTAEKDAVEHVRTALEPVVGSEKASAAAGRVPAALRMVARACKDEVLTREMVPGNTLSTAWALWALDVEALLEGVGEEHRAAARKALRGEE